MTYCLGIITHQGLVMASDSRTNAGMDQVNLCRKMHNFVVPGERALVILASGSLSLTQSVITLLRQDFEHGAGLAKVSSMYDATRIVGAKIRAVAEMDRAPLERDGFKFNVNMIIGGQIQGQRPDLYLVYPQGNPMRASTESPFLQIGECKYGRPILDRGIRYETTELSDAAKYALISFDSTMRSNVTVGPPIDLIVYRDGDLDLRRCRRFDERDPELIQIHTQWELSLRKAVLALPSVAFDECRDEDPGL